MMITTTRAWWSSGSVSGLGLGPRHRHWQLRLMISRRTLAHKFYPFNLSPPHPYPCLRHSTRESVCACVRPGLHERPDRTRLNRPTESFSRPVLGDGLPTASTHPGASSSANIQCQSRAAAVVVDPIPQSRERRVWRGRFRHRQALFVQDIRWRGDGLSAVVLESIQGAHLVHVGRVCGGCGHSNRGDNDGERVFRVEFVCVEWGGCADAARGAAE